MLVMATIMPNTIKYTAALQRPVRSSPSFFSVSAHSPRSTGSCKCYRRSWSARLTLRMAVWCSSNLQATCMVARSPSNESRVRGLHFASRAGLGWRLGRRARCENACMSQSTQQLCQPHVGATLGDGGSGASVSDTGDFNVGSAETDKHPMICHPVTPAELNGMGHINGHAVAGHTSSLTTGEPQQPELDLESHHQHQHQQSSSSSSSLPRLVHDTTRMKELGLERRWKSALSILRALQEDAKADPSLAPDVTVYNAAIFAVSKSGMWEQAVELLHQMRFARVPPNVVSYTGAITAGSRGGNPELSELLLEEMRLEGVMPNVATFNAAISGCAGGGEWLRAVHLLELMRREAGPEAMPEPLTYTLVIKACSRDKQWEVALELLEEMQAEGLVPMVFTFRYVLSALRACDDRAQAYQRSLLLLEGMERLGLELDREGFKYAIEIAAKAGKVDWALEMLDKMEHSGCRRDASPYNQVIAAYGRKKDWERGLSMLERIRQAGLVPTAHSFASAMTACIRSGRPRLALGLLEEMKRSTPQGDDSGTARPNTVVYNILLGICKGLPIRGVSRRNELRRRYGLRRRGEMGANVGRGEEGGAGSGAGAGAGAGAGESSVDEQAVDGWGEDPTELMRTAMVLLDQMMAMGGQCAPDKLSFELAMQACVNASHPEEALKIFRILRRWMAPVGVEGRGIEREFATYRLGLTAASEAGDGASAASMLEEMRQAGIAADEDGVVIPDEVALLLMRAELRRAADAMAACEDREEECDLRDMSLSCYHLAATALGRSALWQQGVRLTQMAAADGVPLSPNTFTSVLGACAKKARWVEALEVLEEARPTLRRQNARSTTSSSPPSPRRENETGSGSKTVPGTASENVPATARAESATGRDRTERRVSVGPKPGHVDYVAPAYTLAMVACREAGKNVQGLRVLRIADEDGVQGDPSLLRLALKCCAKVGAIDREDEREALGRWAGPNGAAIGDKVVEEMAAFGLRLGVEEITDLTQAYGLAGRCEDARSMPGRAIAAGLIPDEQLYASVMNALGYNGFWREAVGVLQSMRRGSSQQGDGGEGARGAGAVVSGADPRAEAVSEETIAEAWPRPGQAAFGSACRACAAQGEWEAVLGIMDDMRKDEVRRTVSVYACAMRAFVEAGAWERAVELVKREMVSDGVDPDVMSYRQALGACLRGARGDGRAAAEAVGLVEDMGGKGLAPDVGVFEALVRVCVEDKRPELPLDRLCGILEASRTRNGGLAERWSTADYQRMETLRMRLLGHLGRWEESLDRLDDMRNYYAEGLDERAFQAAAYACVPAGQWSVIQVLISEATVSCTNSRETPGVAPGVRWEMRRALLAGLAFAGRWKMALDELRDMYGTGSGHDNDDSNAVGGDGDDPDGFDRSSGVRVEGMKGLDGVGVREAHPHGAGGHEGAVERRGDEKRGEREDEDKALRLRNMPNDYRRVIHACLHDGRWELALDLWLEFRNRAENSARPPSIYAAALRACGGLGQWKMAHALLDEMRAAGDACVPGERHFALAACAAAVADEIAAGASLGSVPREGRGDGFEETSVPSGAGPALSRLLEEMSGEGVLPGCQTYAEVCWGRAQCRQWHKASVGVLQLMRKWGVSFSEGDAPGMNHVALSATSSAYSSSPGDGVGAHRGTPGATLRRALDVSGRSIPPREEGMQGLYSRLLAAASRIRVTGSGNLCSAAQEAIRDILADAEERFAPVGGVKPQLIAEAALAFDRAEDWDGAREAALRLVAENDRRLVSGTNVHANDGGDVDDAVRATASALCAAVSVCARLGQLKDAEDLAGHARALTATFTTATDSVDRLGPGAHEFGGPPESPAMPLGAGLDSRACVALAEALERAGWVSRAEALREGLQGYVAARLGVGAGDGTGGGVKLRELPKVGGKYVRHQSQDGDGAGGAVHGRSEELELGGDHDEMVAHDWAQAGAAAEYDAFVRWVRGQEESQVAGDDGDVEEERLPVDSSVPPPPGGQEWTGLTDRELYGW